MDDLLDPYAAQMPFRFDGPEWLLIGIGAVLLRAIPLLILVGAILKLRAFPGLRNLHRTLLAATLLVIALGATEGLAPALVPPDLRVSGVWSFLWIFAVAFVAVAWTRSAIRTRLRPRGIEIATLAALAALALAASGLILPGLGAA